MRFSAGKDREDLRGAGRERREQSGRGSRMRRACCLLAVCCLLAGCGQETGALSGTDREAEEGREGGMPEGKGGEAFGGLITVGYAQVGSESDWRLANSASFKETFTKEKGYDLLFDDGQQKQENQVKAIRKYILQDVDYIVIAPIVETGWETVLQEAKNAGIPVILSDRRVDADESLYTCFVGGNFEKEGMDAGEWLADYLKEQGREKETIRIVTLQGTIGASAERGRTEGFQKVMDQHPNWEMLDIRTGEFTQAKGQEVMQYFLETYPQIDVVISQNDNMTFGAIEAIQNAGRTCGPEGDIIVISFDAVNAAFDCMIEGTINADFECNPLHGPRVEEIIRELEAGRKVDKIQYVEETYFDTTMDLKAIKAERAY